MVVRWGGALLRGTGVGPLSRGIKGREGSSLLSMSLRVSWGVRNRSWAPTTSMATAAGGGWWALLHGTGASLKRDQGTRGPSSLLSMSLRVSWRVRDRSWGAATSMAAAAGGKNRLVIKGRRGDLW